MNKILELREKRAKLWEDTKAFLDSKRDENGILSDDHTEQYEKMEKDVVNLGKEIERLERQSQIELELSKATSEPIRNKPDNSITGELTGRKSKEYMDAFWNLMKNKNMYNVQNALQIGTDSEGGYLAPDEFEKKLIQALNDVNIMRELATIINTAHGDKKIPVVASKGTASWTDEESNSNESDDAFGQVTLGAHKVSTLIKVSEELVNDSVFNLQAYIISEFARRIGTAEEAAFINGDAVGKPTGVFGSADLGIRTAVNNAITFDEVIDLYHSLREPYRKKASWITNDSTIKVVRKLKDSNGQYLWAPSVQAGQPDKILNRPVRTSASAPEIASDTRIMTFGDYSYYWIADREGRAFQRLNELFAVSGQVGYRAYERVDGKLTLSEAVKAMKMAV